MTIAIASPEPCLRQILLAKYEPAKGRVYVVARIHRPCHCTVNGGDENASHPWCDTCDRYPQLVAEIDGSPAGVDLVWSSGEEIDEHEYLYRRAVAVWARQHAPDSPEANPRQPINFNTLPPPRF